MNRPYADNRRFLTLVLACVTFTGALLSSQSCSGQKPGSSWKPDPKSLVLLAPEVRLADYSIKPPKGYKYDTAHRGPATMHAWTGQSAEKGITPTFLIVTIPLSEKDKIKRPEQQLAQVMAGIKNSQVSRTKNWKTTPVESGNVNGIRMVRVRFSAVTIAENRKTTGFCYVCIVGSNGFIFSTQDLEVDGAQRLKATEASVLTFRKL